MQLSYRKLTTFVTLLTLVVQTLPVGAYVPDLSLTKSGISSGPDRVFGTTDDSMVSTAPGDLIKWDIGYANQGSEHISSGSLIETIPANTCYQVGSLSGITDTAKIKFSNNSGSTWDYTPQPDADGVDCAITHIQIDPLNYMSAPVVGEEGLSLSGARYDITRNSDSGREGLELVSYPYEGEHSTRYNNRIITEDVNRDGEKDIIISSDYTDTLQIWSWQKVNAAGDMGYKKMYTLSGAGHGNGGRMNVFDLNNDGYPEIIVKGEGETNSQHFATIYEYNSTTKNFDTTIINNPNWKYGDYNYSGLENSLFVDYDNDGIKEYITPKGTGLVTIRYTSPNVYTYKYDDLGININTISAGDFDQDGILEILLSSHPGRNFGVAKYINGAWSTKQYEHPQYGGIAINVGDPDGDGLENFIVTGYNHPSNQGLAVRSAQPVYIYKWDQGTQTYTGVIMDPNIKLHSDPSDYTEHSVLHGDLDGDGLDEVVILTLIIGQLDGSISNSTTIFHWNGSGYTAIDLNADLYLGRIVDIDNDGKNELVSQGRQRDNNLNIFKWDGTKYVREIIPNSALTWTSSQFDIADTDGDGSLNIVVPDYASDSVVWRRTPVGAWQKWPLVGSLGATTYTELEDVNGDGIKDIFFYNNTLNGEYNYIWKFIGGIYTHEITQQGPHIQPIRSTGGHKNYGDANNDGVMEDGMYTCGQQKAKSPISPDYLVLSGSDSCFFNISRWDNLDNQPGEELIFYKGYYNSSYIYQWNGTEYAIYAKLNNPFDTSISHKPYSIYTGDLNGDGLKDIVVGRISGAESLIYISDISNPNKYRDAISLTGTSDSVRVHIGDIDNDGIGEVILGRLNATSQVWEWNGSQMVKKGDLPDSTSVPDDIQVGDTDGDGVNNIVIAGNGTKDQVYQWNGTAFVEPAQGYLKNPPSKIFFKAQGSYETRLKRPITGFVAWKNFIADEKRYGQPGENTLTYSFAPVNGSACGAPVLTSTGTLGPDGLTRVELNTLDPSVAEWCVSVTFDTTNLTMSPRLFGWRARYTTDVTQSLSFVTKNTYDLATGSILQNTVTGSAPGDANPANNTASSNPFTVAIGTGTQLVIVTSSTGSIIASNSGSLTGTGTSGSGSTTGSGTGTGTSNGNGNTNTTPAITTNQSLFDGSGSVNIIVYPADQATTVTNTITHPDGTTTGPTECTINLKTNKVSCPPYVLKEGNNTVTLTITDGNGNTTQTSFVITLDSTPPSLSTNLDTSTTLNPSGGNNLIGKTDPGSTVQVIYNGQNIPVVVNPDGSFQVPLSYPKDTNTVTVIARDTLGNTVTKNYTLTLPPLGPGPGGGGGGGPVNTHIILAYSGDTLTTTGAILAQSGKTTIELSSAPSKSGSNSTGSTLSPSKILSGNTTLPSTCTQLPVVVQDRDIQRGDDRGSWAESEIYDLKKYGIVDNSAFFRPNDTITRAEFVKVLVRALGCSYIPTATKNPYGDISLSDWYAPYVSFALKQGWISGTEKYFRPNDSITRYEVMLMIQRAREGDVRQYIGETKIDPKRNPSAITDIATQATKHLGITWGYIRTILDGQIIRSRLMARPDDSALRTEVSRLIHRAFVAPVKG